MIPNVIIGGAPKCGTTSLFTWLSDHPEVNPSKLKETFYLLDPTYWKYDPEVNYHKLGLEGYNKFFRENKNDEKIVLEGTTVYIYQETARKVAKEIGAKMIFVLRKPSKRAFSNYRYFFNNRASGKDEKNVEFPLFVEKLLNKKYDFPIQQLNETIENGIYSKYLEKWYNDLGKENIKVLLLENMFSDPKQIVQEVCDWLKIDPSFYNDYKFESENESFVIKSYFLHNITRWLPRMLKDSKLKRRLRKFYKSLNTSKFSNEIDDETKASLKMLDEYYRPYNKVLSQKFDIDLSVWKE